MKNDTVCYRVNVNRELLNKERENILSNKELLENNSKIFALLGSEVRLKIVYLILKNEKMCVCDLSDVLEMKQSPISQHLRKLKDGGILENNREGLIIFYSIPSSMKSNIELLIKL